MNNYDRSFPWLGIVKITRKTLNHNFWIYRYCRDVLNSVSAVINATYL